MTQEQTLREALVKAREGLSNGLWDYGPGQDEHEQCDALIAEIDAALAAPAPAAEPDLTQLVDQLYEWSLWGEKDKMEAAVRAALAAAPQPAEPTYLHASRVDALLAVLEGECDGLAISRETAEAILHYVENGGPAAPAATVQPALTDEQIANLAEEYGVVYRHRSEPGSGSYGFTERSLRAYARALLAASGAPDDEEEAPRNHGQEPRT